MGQRTKRTGSGYVSRYTGSEGPHHDPYHYEEWTVKQGRRVTTIHLGLGVWMRYGEKGQQRNPRFGRHYERSVRTMVARFERRVGVTLKVLEKAMHTLRCRCGERHDFRSATGYPGEHFTICNKCGEHVDYLFNLSEVE